jgi:DNA mismatch endonuclease (patch repair protein)
MADVMTPEQRSRTMSRIGAKDTGIELLLRHALHREGLRYRLHAPELPGKPDIVFPKYKAVIFVNGCFWHSHGCSRSTVPATNSEFWESKLARTRERDRRNVQDLKRMGWRVLTVWECALSGASSSEFQQLVRRVSSWVRSGRFSGEIARGQIRPR